MWSWKRLAEDQLKMTAKWLDSLCRCLYLMQKNYSKYQVSSLGINQIGQQKLPSDAIFDHAWSKLHSTSKWIQAQAVWSIVCRLSHIILSDGNPLGWRSSSFPFLYLFFFLLLPSIPFLFSQLQLFLNHSARIQGLWRRRSQQCSMASKSVLQQKS